MLGPDWSNLLPLSSPDAAKVFLDDLSWNLSWRKEGGLWKVWGGEVLLLEAHTKAEAEAFVLGMALAVRSLPDDMVNTIRQWASQ